MILLTNAFALSLDLEPTGLSTQQLNPKERQRHPTLADAAVRRLLLP
jgi:hypothetical protein